MTTFAHYLKSPIKSTFKSIKSPSIRFYLILMNLVLLCLLFPSISFLFLNEEEKFRDVQLNRSISQMRKSLESRGASLARSMALSSSQAIAGYDFTFLNIMVNQVVADDPEIEYCIIMDTNRRAITHSDPVNVGNVLDHPVDKKITEIIEDRFPLMASTKEQSGYMYFLDIKPDGKGQGDAIMEAISPLYSGEKLWGVLRLGYSLKNLQQEMASAKYDWSSKMKQFKMYLISMTGIFFSFGVLVAALFTRSFVRSMQVLSNGVSKISEGDLEHVIHQKGVVCSEIMDLSTAFNSMTLKLRTSYKQLDEYSRFLEEKVKERTHELQEAQANLLRQAHEAGMAEMAVGILHNIGNAITPAKVGASIMQQNLNNSAIQRHLPEIMAQFKNAVNHADLDKKEKKRLLELIKVFPESINDEYKKMKDEISQIRDKHEHIEGIINLQMRYARLFSDYEEVDINAITDDALQMLDDSIRKRSVVVNKHTKKVPKIKIEQAKLIQIVVNLIKNAYESMDGADNNHPEIVIKTDYEDGPPSYVVFSVKDNGIGFSPAEKEKMFKFGYSSKEKGSGFGLHSCANYLIANNGSISAHSDGKGKGAEFIVRLAVENNNVHNELK
jgi:signal transduction histidine kinase